MTMADCLSPSALKTIDEYLSLPFKGVVGVRCPYFNNARSRQRGQLSVLIGKGSPRDIVEEAQIISLQYHKNLFGHDGCCLHDKHTAAPADLAADIRHFLIDHNLGVDCSGFVTRVLQKHFAEAEHKNILKILRVAPRSKPWRWLVCKLRPVENISITTLAMPENSVAVDLRQARAGDIIIMLETGPNHTRNHAVVITSADEKFLNYAHARAWSSEGKYGHGVALGQIKITNPQAGLLEQEWIENGKIGEANESYLEAKQANVLEIRRLKI